jgi:hypothetical protein
MANPFSEKVVQNSRLIFFAQPDIITFAVGEIDTLACARGPMDMT